MTSRDLQLAWRARRAGAKYSLRIILEARRTGIPLSLAFALVETESGFRNIFGADRGSILKHEKVTKKKVDRLLRFVAAGGPSNGVGLTQLTYPPFIKQANAAGGAHLPKYQLRVGFGALRDKIARHGGRVRPALAMYNAGRADSPVGLSYADKVVAKQRRWHQVLVKGD